MNEAHTATPWALLDTRIVSTVEYLVQPNPEDGEEGSPLTVVDLYGAMGGHGGDAAFILKACNAHDALVDSLRDLLKEYRADGIEEFNDALTRAEAALKLAE